MTENRSRERAAPHWDVQAMQQRALSHNGLGDDTQRIPLLPQLPTKKHHRSITGTEAPATRLVVMEPDGPTECAGAPDGGELDRLVAAAAPDETRRPPSARARRRWRLGGACAAFACGVLALTRSTAPPQRSVRADTAAAAGDQPPLSAYMDPVNGTVYRNHHVRELLDFAIIGHGKCGTTHLQGRLVRHPEIRMHHHELRLLQHRNLSGMVRELYALGPGMRGYKAPNDIRRQVTFDTFRRYWPDTKLIVGVRHPVKHFESYYNYNVRQGAALIPAEQMTGGGLPDQSFFHRHLAQLGKTDISDPAESKLLGAWGPNRPHRLRNPVLLYEVSQIFDTTDGRHRQFARDFTRYLGLQRPIHFVGDHSQSVSSPWSRLASFFRRADPTSAGRTSLNYHYVIDICEDKFAPLRRELLENGGRAAQWIRDYFLPLPDVTVSNRRHFETLLDTWTVDPCAAKSKPNATSTVGDDRSRPLIRRK